MEKFIVIFRKAPYGSVYPIEGARIIQGLMVMDLDAKAVFIDDGVYALTKNNDPSGINMAPVKLTIQNLEALDVPMYVVKDSLDERGLTQEDLEYDVNLITLEELANLLLESDTAITL